MQDHKLLTKYGREKEQNGDAAVGVGKGNLLWQQGVQVARRQVELEEQG